MKTLREREKAAAAAKADKPYTRAERLVIAGVLAAIVACLIFGRLYG